MQHVITSDEARKITKGRTPLVPVEYEQACKSALTECMRVAVPPVKRPMALHRTSISSLEITP
jgi:hypothetical protein